MTRRWKRRRTAVTRPRIPLPRQTGGVHEEKSKRLFRRRKHKKRLEEE